MFVENKVDFALFDNRKSLRVTLKNSVVTPTPSMFKLTHYSRGCVRNGTYIIQSTVESATNSVMLEPTYAHRYLRLGNVQ